MHSMIHVVLNKTKAGGITLATAAALALTGCGGGSGTAATGGGTVTGKFVDATVVGLGYKCGTSTALSGTTNATGQFTCNTGEAVAFYVGGIKLGSVASAQAVVTPLDLVGAGSTPSHPRVINIVRFLMSISSTAAASGTLTIDPAVVTAAVASAIDFTQDAPGNLDSVITAVKPAGATVATGPEATTHMSSSINGLFAGSFSGTFGGSLGGTWTLAINSQGVVTGTATDSAQATYSVTGNMATTVGTGSTYAFTGTSGGVPWAGTLNMNTREFKGTWNDGAGASGTFTGKAATAATPSTPASAACTSSETELTFGTSSSASPYTNGQKLCFTASTTSLSFSGKTLTNPTQNTAVSAPFSAYVFVDGAYTHEVIFNSGALHEINLSSGTTFVGQFAPATAPTGGGTLIVSGVTPSTGNGNFALSMGVETAAGGSSTAKRVEFTDATTATRKLRLYYQPSTGALENIQFESTEKSFNCFVGDPMMGCDTAKITFSATGKSILLNMTEFRTGSTVNGVLEGFLSW